MSGTRSSFAHLVRLAVLGGLLLASPVAAQAQFQGAINTPTASGTVNSPFSISGWATWQNMGSGPGVDLVLIHGCLVSDCAVMSFWGAATYGMARPDVATALGHSRYTNSGFTLTKAGLSSGTYYVAMAVRDTATGAWSTPAALTVTVTATAVPEHTLETPVHGQALTSPVSVQGWAIDASAPSGTGVGAVSLWAHPNPGSGQAGIWIGYAPYGANRGDVAASHGERFRYAGYTASTTALASGANLFGISAQSSHTQAWTSRIVTVYVDTPTVPLTLDRPGSGTGGVTASGLTCVGGPTTQALPCGASYPLHTAVTLTAVPDANSTFAGWGGACTGSGTCQVTLSMARFVTATFTKRPDTIDTRYYHMDVVGSVRAITDAAGNLVTTAGAPSGRHDYRPFGENTNPMTGDPIRFAGKELDPETGQQYFDARYYRNTWGRFSAVDPLHVRAAMTDPQQWNRYAYARNNPLAYGDPSGAFAITIVKFLTFLTLSRGGGGGGLKGYLVGAGAFLVGAYWDDVRSAMFPESPPNPRIDVGRPATGSAQVRRPGSAMSKEEATGLGCSEGFQTALSAALERAGGGFQTKDGVRTGRRCRGTAEAAFAITGSPDNPTYEALDTLCPDLRTGRMGGALSVPEGTFAVVHTHPDNAQTYPNRGGSDRMISDPDFQHADDSNKDFFVAGKNGLDFYGHDTGPRNWARIQCP